VVVGIAIAVAVAIILFSLYQLWVSVNDR